VGQGSDRTHPTCPVTRRYGHERRSRRNDPANEPQVRRAEAANEADRIIGASIASIGDYRFHEGLFGVRGSGSDLSQRTKIPGARSRQSLSGKVPDTHPVGAIYNHNLDVFTIPKIAMENTDAISPAHPVPGTPKVAYPGLQRCRGPSSPLTCLAWPAAWQSLCTGHLDASLKSSALTFTEPGPPEQKAAERRTLGQTAFAAERPSGEHGSTRKRFPDSSERFRSGRREGPDAPRREMCLHLENGDRCKSDKRSGLETRSYPPI
jgi:hypothetical protein